MIFLPFALSSADFVGTQAYVDPVTLKKMIAFVVQQDDRTLMMGCEEEGSGELTIGIKPAAGEYPTQGLLPTFRERFGGQGKARDRRWMVISDRLVLDDMTLGGSKSKAQWLDDFYRDTAYHIRFQTDDGPVSASFEYGDRARPELRKMIFACKPKKVIAELAKIGSELSKPPVDPAAVPPSERDVRTSEKTGR